MKLYHGTSSINLSKVKKEGLLNPFLTDQIEIAQYYAQEACEELGGLPVVLEVEADTESLRYDEAAMDEPVRAKESKRDFQWQRAAEDHPEWVKDDIIIIPPQYYEYSLIGVNSVGFEGIIKKFTILKV